MRGLFDEKDEEKRFAIADEQRLIGLDVELAFRQIYELLYAVKVLIKKAGRPATISLTDWEELDRLCIYRGYLVVHKEMAERRRSGLMWGSKGKIFRSESHGSRSRTKTQSISRISSSV